MTSSTRRNSPILLTGIVLLLLAACQGQPLRPLQETEIPAGGTLVRAGMAGSDLVVTLDNSATRCRAAEAWVRHGGSWTAAGSAPGLGGASCPRVTAQLSGDGHTLAIYDYGAGKAELQRIGDGTITQLGTAALGGSARIQFPPPGPNVGLSQDGSRLLLGSLNRGCAVRADGERGCGMARLFERRGDGWEPGPAILPTTDLAQEVQFGQSVALDAAGTVAVVGGMGQPGLSGGLGVYSIGDDKADLVQILRPETHLPGFAADLAISGDGRWLAVGGDQSVHLYERAGPSFVLRIKLTPPDTGAGYFGETVALSGDGRRLLTGAPRTDCAEGARCGLAYLYERGESWHLARTLRPATEAEDANVGHHLALSADGRTAAVQGAVIHVFALGDGD